MNRGFPAYGLCVALVALGAAGTAGQEVDRGRDQKTSGYAHLTVWVDAGGKTRADLLVVASHGGPLSLQRELEKGNLTFPGSTLQEVRLRRPEGRQVPQAGEPEYLQARWDGAWPRRGLVVEGEIDPAPLLELLHRQRVPVKWLTVSVLHPRTPFTQCTPENRASLEDGAWGPHSCFLRVLATEASPPPLRVAFGYRAADVLKLFAPFAVLLALPTSLVLWRRWAALRPQGKDPARVWFGYWRFLRWLMVGTQLGWLAAVLVLGLGPSLRHVTQFALGKAHVPDYEASPYRGPIQFGLLDLSLCLLPAAAVMVLSTALSHPVFARVRGAEWTRGDLVRQVLWAQLAFILPGLFGLAGLTALVHGEPRLGVTWFAVALGSYILCRRLRARAHGRMPHALTEGELRDRVFALADKAGVRVKQVYLLPTGKGHEANAAAILGNAVVLNDYLVRHLSKREVDAVIAHELAHLRHRHPRKLGAQGVGVFLVAVFAPTVWHLAWTRWPEAFPHWLAPEGVPGVGPWMPFVLPLLILLAYALLRAFRSRRFERAADAGEVELTGDPEAGVTALVKLARLNLLPMQWGRWDEPLLTHPSTSRRIQAIGRQGGISPERLEEILAAPDDAKRYTLPAALTGGERVFSSAFKGRVAFRVSWALIAVITLTPALAACLAQAGAWEGPVQWWIYGAGLLATLAAFLAAANFLAVLGEAGLERRLRARLEREGIPPGTWGGLFVGFAPGPVPRLYEHFADWDMGFLFLGGDHLCYVGEQARFALRRDQVRAARLGLGLPRWWRSQRVYVTWQDGEREGVFSLRPGGVRSLRHLARETPALDHRLQKWWEEATASSPPPAPLADLTPPSFGAVTGISPHSLAGAGPLLGELVVLSAVAAGVAVLLSLPFSLRQGGAAWYVLAVTCLLVVFQRLPLWWYRDPAGSVE